MGTNQKIIAFLGKGGVGKTVATALTARLLKEQDKSKILLIDADPAMGLSLALRINPRKTIAQARAEILKKAQTVKALSDKRELAMTIDYLILECLMEKSGFGFLVMGRSQARGCYCAVNNLLRESITELSQRFDWIIIDAEAGIEQVNREVTQKVNFPLIITDHSLRGIITAQAINSTLKKTYQSKAKGVIFNRCLSPDKMLLKKMEKSGLKYLGSIPIDNQISEYDRIGKSLLEIPANSKGLRALKKILVENKIL